MLRNLGKWCVGLVAAMAIGAGVASAADVVVPDGGTVLLLGEKQGADILQKGDLVAVCGDSITEQKDYSVDIEAYLTMCRGGDVRSAQLGWGGDSMGWLWGRGAQKDILAFHPTIVTTCYGMNDGGYKPIDDQTTKNYRDGMLRLVKTLKDGGVRQVVVGSPGAVDNDTYRHNPQEAAMYNKTLAALAGIAKDVASQTGSVYADVHDPMMDVMTKAKAKYGAGYAVAGGDGVHPAANGHLVMAYAFLKAMGCDGEIGTISVDLKSGAAKASDGHKVVSSKDGEVEVESSRYPFCFWGKPSDPNATTGIIEFFPFNDDLNRLKLVVTNAPAERMRVTWGNSSKEFAAADLAKGINLAAEFTDNPFSGQFGKIRQSIARKQDYETMLYKSFLPFGGQMQDALKESNPKSDAYDQLKAAMFQRDNRLAGDVAKQVTPLTHTIRLEAVK